MASVIHDTSLREFGYLPKWWRHALVAVATLIFSSCNGFTAPSSESAFMAAALAAGATGAASATEQVDEQPGKPITNDRAAPEAETRELLQGQEIHVAPPQTPPPGVVAMEQLSSQQYAAACDCGPGATGPIPWIGHGDEYLCDGGDFGSPAGVRTDWKIEGVEQEDSIAHYDTLDGRVRVTPSNRVCVYAPRFAAVRQVVNAMASEQPVFIAQIADELSLAKAGSSQPVASSLQRHAASINMAKMPPILFRQREQAGEIVNLQGTMEVYDSLAAYSNLQVIRLGQINDSEAALVRRSSVAAITWAGDQGPQVLIDNRSAQAELGIKQAGVIYQTDGPDSPRLRLIKLASAGFAQLGDEIEFTLRYDNTGDQIIGNVTIVDNLATRLEYVPGSARSTADATFVVTPNDNGSAFLRWEIQAPVEPGRGGILQFRARVR